MKPLLFLVRPAEIESATSTSGGWRSIQLSYGRTEYKHITEEEYHD